MAKVGRNMVTTGLSGKLGDLLVFRVVNGKTVVSQAPAPSSKEPSEAQIVQKKKFQKAVLYAKSAIASPEIKAAYEAEAADGKSAYNVAVADFLNAPQIEEIDISTYTGKVGDTIQILPTDDFEVTEVSVTIENADGTIVENGQAIQTEGSPYYTFTATALNETLDGDKITIQVSDVPGNTTTEQKDISLN